MESDSLPIYVQDFFPTAIHLHKRGRKKWKLFCEKSEKSVEI